VPADDPTPVTVRDYRPEDAEATLQIFVDAITRTAAADYTPEQVQAWARPGQRSVPAWHEAMQARGSVVACVGTHVAGFSDVSDTGYVDMMFTSPRFARRGVASALIRHVEQRARERGLERLHADVSVTARPFFAKHGFVVLAEQHPVTQGVTMTNYRMEKRLDGAS